MSCGFGTVRGSRSTAAITTLVAGNTPIDLDRRIGASVLKVVMGGHCALSAKELNSPEHPEQFSAWPRYRGDHRRY